MIISFYKNPVGYLAIIRLLDLKVIPNYCWSFIDKGTKRVIEEDGVLLQFFTKNYALYNPEDIFENLEFALKYEGVNLEIIKAIFEKIDSKAIENFILNRPLGKTERKLWYIYELLFNEKLNIPDLETGNYIDLLSVEEYYVAAPIKSKRHKINDNLLGNANFCPFVRKTEILKNFDLDKFNQKIQKLFDLSHNYIVKRAVRYLYLKETVSSWNIEHETPTKQKELRFINALQNVGTFNILDKNELIKLQNIIIDQDYLAKNYRTNQIFVGSISRSFMPNVDYLPPRPNDISQLMDGLLNSLTRMLEANINPIVIAATISFGFVFIHPFEDGNGRIHRFLIHYILVTTGFVSKNMIFPISAVMLEQIDKYIDILESFSQKLMNFVEYETVGMKIQVNNDYYNSYAYIDYTHFAEYLLECLNILINHELPQEIEFIEKYEKVKKSISDLIDMPSSDLDLLIKLALQNNGKLAQAKREKFFGNLSDKQVKEIEEIINIFNTNSI